MPQRVMPCYHGECAPLPGPVFRLQRVHVVESELLVFVAADGSGAQARHSKLGSSSSLPLQNELDGCPSKEDINHDTTMFYRTLTFEQQQEALRQSNIILKPPIPRKPKLPPMTAEHGGCCKSAGDTNLQMLSIAAGSAANSVGAHDDPVSSEATSTDSEVKDEATHLNDEEDDFSEPAYPCICQHLEEHGRTDTIEVDEVHSTAAVRKFWLKKSMEDADISMRYRSARDPGQSQATTSSSSSSASSGLSYCAPRPQRIERPRLPPRLPPHPCRSVKLGRPSPRPPAARGAGPMQQSCDEAVSPQSPTSSVPTNAPAVAVAAAAAATANSSAGVSAVEDPPFPANSLPARTRPLTAATRIDTLERNRIDAIEDEHKYETLDHAARPGYYSEDEGVCCTNIHSQLAKKAKELVRPYQKGDHPRDRPPIPAKPPRSTIGKVPRPPSNEGISDSEANYKESLDLVQEVKTAAQLSGYEPIDTSRSAVPPLPGVPTKGPLKKKETNTTKVVTTAEGMEEVGEKKFRPVLESQSSIELKSAKARTEAPTDTVTSQIDVSVASKARGSRDNSKKDPAVESSKSDEKRGLIERVKGMKVENPFKKTDADSKDKEDEADSEERKPGLMGKMFKRDKDPKASADDDLDDKEKRSLSEKLSKVFHRDKKEGADVTSDTPPEEKVKLSDKLGRMFGKDSREPKDASDITDEDKKPSLMSKIFGKDSKEPTNKFDDEEDGSKPFPINRVFSRDARDDAESENADDVSERRTFSDKLSDFKHKVFSKKPNDEGDVAPIGDEQGEKKTFMERYFPVEKPTIQQIVLTEEMEPDLKKRRIGKITSFQQTMEVEGDLESPAKKLMKEKIDKLTTKFKEVQEMMPRTLSIKKETGSAPDEGIAEATEQNEGSAKHDYEVKTHIVFTKDQTAAVHKQVKAVSEASGPSDPNDRQPTPVPSEGSDRTADKTRVFYAKIGDSEIEVKEEHYGRIQMGDKKEPIYARPFKMLKRSLNELSKSTPSLSAKTDEPIEYIDAAEVEKHANDDDDEDNNNDVKNQHVNHHYDELSEPGKKKKIVAELKVRGGQGSPRVIKIETQLVKGKSLSALNEPATMTTIKTVEKQKPPVPPRPRPTTPTIIGKPASQPATPVSSVDSPPLAALAERPSEDGSAAVPVRQRPLNGELAAEVAPAADKSAELESAPPTSTATVGTKKIPPPRPPPPRISTVTTKVTPTTITTTTVASGARPQTTTFRKPPKPQRPPPPKVTVTKTVLRTPLGSEMAKNDKFSVYCQTDVGLSTDLLARIEQVVSTGSGSVSGSPYRPPRSRSTSRENLCNLPGQSPGSLFQTQATFYDEPVRVRKAASLNESDLSKRISSLQSFRRSLIEQGGPPLQAAVTLAIVLFWIYCPFFLLSFQSLCCLALLFLVFFQ